MRFVLILFALLGAIGAARAQHTHGRRAGGAGASAHAVARPKGPESRDADMVRLTRMLMAQILKGKVDPALLTPAMRARTTPGKVKPMGAWLKGYGPLKSVTLASRKPSGGKDTGTLKVMFGQTVFIATVAVTPDRHIDSLLLIEE